MVQSAVVYSVQDYFTSQHINHTKNVMMNITLSSMGFCVHFTPDNCIETDWSFTMALYEIFKTIYVIFLNYIKNIGT